MKRFIGIIFILSLLGITLSASKFTVRGNYVYDDSDTLDFDTLEILEAVEEIMVDSSNYITIDNIAIIGNGLMDDYDTDSIASLDESSAKLYVGKQFKVKNQDGSEYEYRVNADGLSVTVLRGIANGTKKLVIPSVVEGLDTYFFVTDIAAFAFMSHAESISTAMKGVEELIISEGVANAGTSCFQLAKDLEYVSLPTSLTNISDLST